MQVHFPGGNQELVQGQTREVWSHLPSHPEVPDSLSVSPGPGKRIRQLMGWTKVCGTRYQAGKGKCGHTWSVSLGYGLDINQSINGLDEGVWNHTVGVGC